MYRRRKLGPCLKGKVGSRLLLGLMAGLAVACAATPPSLTLPTLTTEEPAFATTMQAFSGASIYGNNRVRILLNGQETFPALRAAVRSARKTLTFEAYIFREGRIADDLVEGFIDRCRAGVRVSILLDAHGSGDVPPRYVSALREAGCDIVPEFRPLSVWNFERSNHRNHRRILVVDGRIGITGGYGVDDAWSGDGRTKDQWRDTDVWLEGPAVQDLQAAFIEHWKEATGVLLGGEEYFPWPPVEVKDEPVRAQVVRSAPTRDNFAIHRTFLQAISAAQRTIYISTPYLFPGDQLAEALKRAVARGVEVRILVPSVVRSSGVEFITQASQRIGFGELLDAGITLNEYEPALLHTKTMVIDGCWATIGSTNFDNRSMAMNDELNVILYDRDIARHLEGIFLEDLRLSKTIDRAQLRERPLVGKWLGLLTSPLHDFF